MFSMVKFYQNAADIATGYKAENEFLAEFGIHCSRDEYLSHKKDCDQNGKPYQIFNRVYKETVIDILNKKAKEKLPKEVKNKPNLFVIDAEFSSSDILKINEKMLETAISRELTIVPKIHELKNETGKITFYKGVPDVENIIKKTRSYSLGMSI